MEKINVPPIKIQGIKTKLLTSIEENLPLPITGKWIEPFMGSGVVGFNLAPKKALFCDINPYLIDFYNHIQTGKITSISTRKFLEDEGKKLVLNEDYYYKVRERFNISHNPLDFLFLNRSCFNGMIRFNRSGKFNVPFGHKPERFAKAYITKIVNQILYLENKFKETDWEFKCQSFKETLNKLDINENDFIYCDPPYTGRHVDYFDSWTEIDENDLHFLLENQPAKYMVSTWDNNKYRSNPCISQIWSSCRKINKETFYFVGAKESNRNSMTEAFLVNYNIPKVKTIITQKQLMLF